MFYWFLKNLGANVLLVILRTWVEDTYRESWSTDRIYYIIKRLFYEIHKYTKLKSKQVCRCMV